MIPPMSVVLCEGFLDRSFLAGWLEHLGCRPVQDNPTKDPYGRPVVKGKFGYRTPHGHFVLVQPVHTETLLDRSLHENLRDHATRPMHRVVVVRDADADAPAGRQEASDRRRGHLDRAVAFMDRIGLTDRPTLDVICWWTDAPVDQAGIPAKQTLERILCAASADADAERASSVSSWLVAAPAGPGPTHKNFAAAWFAKFTKAESHERFFRECWEDTAIRAALLGRLDAIGAAAIVNELVNTGIPAPNLPPG